MHRKCDDVSGARMDELAMAAFTGALLDIPSGFQSPD
jgi:hypothetical protein